MSNVFTISARELDRLRAIERAAIEWKKERDKAILLRIANPNMPSKLHLSLMAPVGKALDNLAKVLP